MIFMEEQPIYRVLCLLSSRGDLLVLLWLLGGEIAVSCGIFWIDLCFVFIQVISQLFPVPH